MANKSDIHFFEKIYREHFSGLVNFAFRYVGDSETAKEIVQEMFSKIWQNFDQLNVEVSIKSYLYGAVRNACLNHLKHQNVVKKHASQINYDYVQDSPIEFDELSQKVDRLLSEIPEKCREIFLKSRFESKKYKEIAQELGISIKTVENQMGKALKILREGLSDYLPTGLIFICVGVIFYLVVN